MSKNEEEISGEGVIDEEVIEETPIIEEEISGEGVIDEEVIEAPTPFVKPEGHVVINGSVVPDPTKNGVNTINMY
jgi:hypothetical protein